MVVDSATLLCSSGQSSSNIAPEFVHPHTVQINQFNQPIETYVGEEGEIVHYRAQGNSYSITTDGTGNEQELTRANGVTTSQALSILNVDVTPDALRTYHYISVENVGNFTTINAPINFEQGDIFRLTLDNNVPTDVTWTFDSIYKSQDGADLGTITVPTGEVEELIFIETNGVYREFSRIISGSSGGDNIQSTDLSVQAENRNHDFQGFEQTWTNISQLGIFQGSTPVGTNISQNVAASQVINDNGTTELGLALSQTGNPRSQLYYEDGNAPGRKQITIDTDGITLQLNEANDNLTIPVLPAYADDAAAGVGGLNFGDVYQTDGTAATPLNVAGILMIKQ